MTARIRAFGVLAVLLCGCSLQAAPRVHPDWQFYFNRKYGYQIEYPAGYDLWETGLEGEQDGARIRIGLHEYQAVTPALDVLILPETAAARFPPLGMQPVDLTLRVQDIDLNGLPARRAEYRWKANGRLAYMDIEMDRVVFQFMAGPETRDFYATDWWSIIQTFRFAR